MRTTWTRTQTRTTRASDEPLRLAIEPVAVETFFAERWEQQPLHVARRGVARFDHLLSGADVERLICSSAIREPAFRLVRAGDKLDARDYTVDVPWRPRPFGRTADLPRVLAEVEAGATLVLQGLHLSWQPLAEYCRALEALLRHRVQANAYLTPSASQGLPVHHDTHDVFVLQVEGRKRWLIYEPVLELPLRDQRYRLELGKPGAVVLDLTLAPGDTLYLPRGWLHEAVASDEDSLHLTVGVNVYTWLDAFKAALDDCGADVEYRRAVSDGGEQIDDLLDRLAERLDADQIARRRSRKLRAARRPILDGQLSQLRALDALSSETYVERRPSTIAEFAIDEDGVSLFYDGKEIRFPPHARPAVECLFDADRAVCVGDLPGLDEAGRLVLVRRLVREGFLRILSPPDALSRRSDEAAAE
jgi:ribosomal protein L16 Arg81 hydroxylase